MLLLGLDSKCVRRHEGLFNVPQVLACRVHLKAHLKETFPPDRLSDEDEGGGVFKANSTSA